MVALNRVLLAGNLTRDPEVRYTPSGSAVADLNMAINRVYTSGGEQKEETCYVNVVVWGRQAEMCGEHLSKGSPVLIEGSLQYDTWQTDGGEKRSRLRVRADRVQFLGRSRKGGEMGDAPEGAGQYTKPSKKETSREERPEGPMDAPPGPAADSNEDLPF